MFWVMEFVRTFCLKILFKFFISLSDNVPPPQDTKLRLCIVKALILLRSKGMVTPEATLPLFFKMFGIHDKVLRYALCLGFALCL
jgi:hypothetical protein